MKLTVQVVVEPDGDAPTVVRDVFCLERGTLGPDSLGLGLAEAKELLAAVQATMVDEQVNTTLAAHAACDRCGTHRRHKDARRIVVRTLFGTLRLPSPRWHHCSCQSQQTRTFSPLAALLPERATPELAYLEAKFAGLMSYGLTTKVLAEVLPLGRVVHATEARRHTHAVAQRLDDELGPEQPAFIEGCPAVWEDLPRPDLPLTVGLDGGYVHSAHQRSRRDGWFEVIAGKSIPAEGCPKCFGFVQTFDTKPKRRLFELLCSQGLQANQQVTFLTDGADDVRDLPLYLNPQAEHLLDWFHITMRITIMNQMAKGIGSAEERDLASEIAEQLERLKWLLWHGNVFRALQTVGDLEIDLDVEGAAPEQAKLIKAVREFGSYIDANAGSIPNYGERHRAGETISTAFVESTVNQVISKRMVKKQQMRWTPRGAHLLLQVRTRDLNDELADDFHRWYPGFTHTAERHDVAA